MAPYYNRPDNTLKRVDDLIALGKDMDALQALQETINMKQRGRNVSLNDLEPQMEKIIELGVKLRQGKAIKESLHQFRNAAQNLNTDAIERIVKKLIELSGQKVEEARKKADKLSIEVDDLEALETPESIMLSTVSGEQTKDRTDREVVTPWLKFLWEIYRNVLDITRNNARLETIYHDVTKMAFKFCLTYTRKTEFRRLCEILRNHFQNIGKYSNHPHSININDSDILQHFLESRFRQLNAAVDLELWQEAFKSVEDIYTLLTTSKRPAKPEMMANYYEKLTKIFMVGEDFLFHSTAWNRFSNIERAINKNMTDEKQSRMASIVLLSALAIPIITTTKTRPGYVETDDTRTQKLNRLSMLMGLREPPSRTGLLKEALNKNILTCVRPEIRDLYNILEVQFHPLSICKKINPIMQKLSEDKDMAKYVRPLHQVILTRLLQQLSQVYTTVKLDFVLQLASFPEPYNYDAATIEKFIMNGCKRGELSIRIDHASQSLTFETDLFAPPKGTVTEGSQLQSSPSDLMRTQLSRLGVSLHAVVQMIDPAIKENAAKDKQEALQRALTGIEEEHKAMLERKNTIEKRKEAIEQKEQEAERKRKEEKEKAARRKEEEEAARRQEEEKRRLEEQARRTQEEIMRAEKLKKVEQVAAKIGIDVEEAMKAGDIQEICAKAESEEIQVRKKLLDDTALRISYTERVFRKEERTLLEEDREKQRKLDEERVHKLNEAEVAAAKVNHVENIEMKKRSLTMLEDYRSYKKEIEDRRNAAVKAKKQAAEEAIEKEKQERIAKWRSKKEALDKERAQEEAERKQREEEKAQREEERKREEDERREREEKAAKERAEKLREEKAAREEQRRKLDEMARKQAEREAEIERKMQERNEAPRNTPGKYAPPQKSGSSEDSWRRAGPPSQSRPFAPSSTGRYVPLGKREDSQQPPSRQDWSGRGGFSDRNSDASRNPFSDRSTGMNRRDGPPGSNRPGAGDRERKW